MAKKKEVEEKKATKKAVERPIVDKMVKEVEQKKEVRKAFVPTGRGAKQMPVVCVVAGPDFEEGQIYGLLAKNEKRAVVVDGLGHPQIYSIELFNKAFKENWL